MNATTERHSKEPWKAEGFHVYDATGDEIIDCCGKRTVPDEDEYNARRLAACVNACRTISIEDLEGAETIREKVAALEVDIRKAREESAGLREERDELEEKCERLESQIERLKVDMAYYANGGRDR